jgi:hypothetical protein
MPLIAEFAPPQHTPTSSPPNVESMTESKASNPEAILKRSGHAQHSRVVNLLRGDGWSVVVSPYYSDNFSDKPREIDIIAEKAFSYDHAWHGVPGGGG